MGALVGSLEVPELEVGSCKGLAGIEAAGGDFPGVGRQHENLERRGHRTSALRVPVEFARGIAAPGGQQRDLVGVSRHPVDQLGFLSGDARLLNAFTASARCSPEGAGGKPHGGEGVGDPVLYGNIVTSLLRSYQQAAS
jgi:hypothetical protein